MPPLIDIQNSRPAALLQHTRSIHALVLRNIQTRFGASYFGFLFGLLIPLGHLAIVLAIYIATGRTAAIGTDVTIYLTTAILPFVVWSYTYQRMMRALLDNQPLLSFPTVKPIDIALSQSIVELLNSIIIISVVYFSLIIMGKDIHISNYKDFAFSLLLSYVLGVSMGLPIGSLMIIFPAFYVIALILIPTYWAACGAFFLADTLPEQIKLILTVFPIAHTVDFGRSAYYYSYSSSFYNLYYVYTCIIINIVAFLLLSRFARAALSSK